MSELDYKNASKRCYPETYLAILNNKLAFALACSLESALDDSCKYTIGRLLTFIESLGGDEQTVKARKDVLRMITRELETDHHRISVFKSQQLEMWLDNFKKSYDIKEKSGQKIPPLEHNEFKDIKSLNEASL